MMGNSFGIVSMILAQALLANGAQAASPAVSAGTGTGGCVVVLDCGGVTQQAVPDADGRFVFRDAPQGECTVRAVENAAPQAATQVAAPRDAASGMATGKRMHKPVRFQVTLENPPGAARAAAPADLAADGSVRVVARGKGHELKGHVTLIK